MRAPEAWIGRATHLVVSRELEQCCRQHFALRLDILVGVGRFVGSANHKQVVHERLQYRNHCWKRKKNTKQITQFIVSSLGLSLTVRNGVKATGEDAVTELNDFSEGDDRLRVVTLVREQDEEGEDVGKQSVRIAASCNKKYQVPVYITN